MKNSPGVLPADAVGYLWYYTPMANCRQTDDNQNDVIDLGSKLCVLSFVIKLFILNRQKQNS